jgi:predicted O-methyltransferase YrrM
MLTGTEIRTPPRHDRILRRSQELQFSMNSDVLTGSLLRALAATKPSGAFLELGTGCGLGTCWLLDGMDTHSRLISVDHDPRVQAIAGEELGGDLRLTLSADDGGDFLSHCTSSFDLIFADAWPGKFTHLDVALGLLSPGGIYVIDDLLPEPNWPIDHAPKVAALLAALDASPGLVLTPLAWSTGVLIAVKTNHRN